MSDDEEASQHDESTVHMGEILGGKYEVVRLIGKGGMGSVVEARHLELGEPVALKVLHPRYLDNAEAVARFQQEARAAVQIRGEHSARLLDVGTAPSGAPFLVMELLVGEDLANLGGRGPLPMEDAVQYILQACEGIAEVHAHGIIHRDLKPGNLFLTSRPDGSPLIKVLDFGIAKNVARDPSIGTLTMTLVALGTPLYMAPEQIRSSRTVDARADVWSLGAILYELLAGKPAFGGNTVAHITAQVLEAQPEPLTRIRSDVPASLDAAVRRALAKEADQRWVDVAAFAAAIAPHATGDAQISAARTARILSLGVFASDTPMTTTLGEEGPGTVRFARRSRGRMVAVAAAALAIVAVGLLVSRPPRAPLQAATAGVGKAASARFSSATLKLLHAASDAPRDRPEAPQPVTTAERDTPKPTTKRPAPSQGDGEGAAARLPAPGRSTATPQPPATPNDGFDPLGSRK